MASLLNVLLIEDDSEHADLIRMHVSRKHGAVVKIEWAGTLKQGLRHLEENSVDVILLDLGLPDSTLETTLQTVLRKAVGIPIVVLSSLEDEDFGIRAVHQGAQDYICKAWMDGEVLFRALHYAVERKAIEEELRQANRTKDEFLATLSHELRTPAGVIQGFAELLINEIEDPQERTRAALAILRNSKLLVGLINDLLDMSRIITGKLSLQNGPQDMVGILNESIQSVGIAAKSKKIQIRTNLEPTESRVSGDPVRLHQIFWNVLSNAIKFTHVGGVIDIQLAKKGNFIEVTVADNGEGIAPEFLPFVFDKFRQQDSSIRRQYGGMGVGLAIVKYLVELHGGTVQAKSDGRGQGSCFSMTFPVMAVSTEEFTPRDPGELPTAGEGNRPLENPVSQENSSKPLIGLRVLAIDDSPDVLSLVSFMLRRSGAEVETVLSAREASVALEKKRPDVIICDIGMPDEDGYTFLRRLRSLESQRQAKPIPAAALTAYTRQEEKDKALEAGFQVHLSKPIQYSTLIEAMARLSENLLNQPYEPPASTSIYL